MRALAPCLRLKGKARLELGPIQQQSPLHNTSTSLLSLASTHLPKKMVVVAIAGGTGGIGRAIIEELERNGKHDVIILGRKVSVLLVSTVDAQG